MSSYFLFYMCCLLYFNIVSTNEFILVDSIKELGQSLSLRAQASRSFRVTVLYDETTTLLTLLLFDQLRTIKLRSVIDVTSANATEIDGIIETLKSTTPCVSLKKASHYIIVITSSTYNSKLDQLLKNFHSSGLLERPSVWILIRQTNHSPSNIHGIRKLYCNLYSIHIPNNASTSSAIQVYKAKIQKTTLVWTSQKSGNVSASVFERISLSSSELRAAIVHWSNYAYCPNSRKGNVSVLDLDACNRYEGVMVEIFDALAHTLGFQYEFVPLWDNYWTDAVGNRWPGIIAQVAAGEAELTLWYDTSYLRKDVVDYTYPVTITPYAFLIQKPRSNEAFLWSFGVPFSWPVWGSTIGCLLLSGLFLFGIQRVLGGRDGQRFRRSRFTLFRSMWTAFLPAMKQGEERFDRLSFSGKLLLTVWGLGTFLISTYYTAFLFSSMASTEPALPFRTMEQLLEKALSNQLIIGAYNSTPLLDYFRTHRSTTVQRLYDVFASSSSSSSHIYNSNEDIVAAMNRTTNLVVITFSEVARSLKRQHCFLHYIDIEGQPLSGAMLVQKHSCLKSIFDRHIIKFHENGLYNGWKRKHEVHDDCHAQIEDFTRPTFDRDLGLDHMLGTFYLFLCGCLISCIAWICELIKTYVIGV